jgi:hypothetical protein
LIKDPLPGTEHDFLSIHLPLPLSLTAIDFSYNFCSSTCYFYVRTYV